MDAESILSKMTLGVGVVVMDGHVQQLLKFIARWDRRLRLTHTTLWVPRGLAIALLVAVIVAIISRLRPWLLPTQVLIFAVGVGVLGIVTAAIVVWSWPRNAIKAARFFDRRFDLKERVSTTLELRDGAVKAPEELSELLVSDTLAHAKQVNAARALPLQWRRRELFGVLVLMVALALLLLIANPQTEVVAQQQAINQAVQEQIQKLEEIKKDIQERPDLTEAEKAELQQIVQEAIDKLEQPNITQPEAVAALSQAKNELEEAGNPLTQEQLNAMQQAGRSMTGSPASQDVGQALQSGDLQAAANALDSLAKRVGEGQLTPEQLKDLADALKQAADQLEAANPAAADALRRAADALERGDLAGAQKALEEAADALRDQQQQQSQTPENQAAQNAASQMGDASQQMAQAGQNGQNGSQTAQTQPGQDGNQQDGQQGNQSGQQGSQSGQQGNQSGQQGNQSGQQGNQSGQQGNQSGQQGNQSGQQGNQSGQQGNQSGQQGNQSGQQGDQSGQQGNQSGQQGNQSGQQGNQSGQQGGQSGQQGNQSGQQGDQSGQGGQDGQQGNQSGQGGQSGQQGGQSGQQGDQSGAGASGSGTAGDNPTRTDGQQGGNSGAGQGSGGAGSDVTTGLPTNNPGPGDSQNGQGNDGSLANNDFVYAPSFIGGQGGQQINPSSQNPDNPNDPTEQGDYISNPTGDSMVPLGSVAGTASAQADQAMDTDRVPGSLRGVIRNYFTNLQER